MRIHLKIGLDTTYRMKKNYFIRPILIVILNIYKSGTKITICCCNNSSESYKELLSKTNVPEESSQASGVVVAMVPSINAKKVE